MDSFKSIVRAPASHCERAAVSRAPRFILQQQADTPLPQRAVLGARPDGLRVGYHGKDGRLMRPHDPVQLEAIADK